MMPVKIEAERVTSPPTSSLTREIPVKIVTLAQILSVGTLAPPLAPPPILFYTSIVPGSKKQRGSKGISRLGSDGLPPLLAKMNNNIYVSHMTLCASHMTLSVSYMT